MIESVQDYKRAAHLADTASESAYGMEDHGFPHNEIIAAHLHASKLHKQAYDVAPLQAWQVGLKSRHKEKSEEHAASAEAYKRMPPTHVFYQR
jgi:aspartokinase